MKYFAILIFFISINNVFGQRLKIRILNEKNVKSLIFAPAVGKYNIYCDTLLIVTLNKNEVVNIIQNGDSIDLKSLNSKFGTFKSLNFIGVSNANYAKIKCVIPSIDQRLYDDDLKITVLNKSFNIINDVEIENYVAGVVESEGGQKANIEYYKTQAVLCRTYALENITRHILEGYYLCDNVHCQAYNGKSLSNFDIPEATSSTSGLVIVDSTLNLITAAFHSNCGGQTVGSEDVWLKSKSYLKPVIDSYCISQRCAIWEKTIPLEKWKQYLKSNGFQISNYTNDSTIYNFNQISRKTYYRILNDSIALRKIRLDFNLRSTFFNITVSNNNLFLKGRGYGHAVGLCQEGAMQMAKKGISYQEIIKFYYKNTYIVSLRALNFFKTP